MTPPEAEYRTRWLIAHNRLHELVWGQNPKADQPPDSVSRQELQRIWRDYLDEVRDAKQIAAKAA